MTIIEAEIGKIYKVKYLNATGSLRQKLISFGILKGVEIKYLAHTNLKSNYEIQIGKITLALRKEEAQNIEVE